MYAQVPCHVFVRPAIDSPNGRVLSHNGPCACQLQCTSGSFIYTVAPLHHPRLTHQVAGWLISWYCVIGCVCVCLCMLSCVYVSHMCAGQRRGHAAGLYNVGVDTYPIPRHWWPPRGWCHQVQSLSLSLPGSGSACLCLRLWLYLSLALPLSLCNICLCVCQCMQFIIA